MARSPKKSTKRAGGRRAKEQVVETTSAALAVGRRSGRLLVAAVLVAVALLVIGHLRTASSGSTARPPSALEVSAVAYGCPVLTGGGDPTTSVAVTSLPGVGSGSGKREARRLPGADPVAALSDADRGQWADASAGARTRSISVSASDGHAPGTVAFAAASGGSAGGRAVTGCARPAAERWFVGASSTGGHRSTLVLTNTSTDTGVVEVSLVGTSGEVEAVGGQGIEVAPNTVRTVALNDLAAGEDDLAVHVVVRRGAVAASLSDASTDAGSRGSEWLPATAAPAERVTVAGVPAGRGSRTLLVLNPSDRTASVGLSVSGKDGVFTPTGLESVDAAPQTVTAVTLPASVSSDAYAVTLTSEVPVTAAVRTREGDDYAWAAATGGWTGTAVMPMRVGRSLDVDGARLLVTAPEDRAAKVRLVGRGADGSEVGKADVDVAAGTTVAVDPTGQGGVGRAAQLASVEVSADDVAVRAAAVYPGSGLAAMPLTAAPVREAAPEVVPAAP